MLSANSLINYRHMNVDTAVAEMLKGNKIRWKSWWWGRYIHLVKGQIKDNEGKNFPKDEMTQKEGWEIYNESEHAGPKLASILLKIAITFKEYKKLHPGTKKTPADPLFTSDKASPSTKTPDKSKQKSKEVSVGDILNEGSSKPAPLEADNPRAAAETEAKEKEKDYAFARQSDVGNLGEDLEASARHKRNQWKSLEDAEKEGTAEELITRENLFKNEPPNILAKVTPDTSLTALAMQVALRKFPASPDTSSYTRYGDDKAVIRKEYTDDAGTSHTLSTSLPFPAGAKNKKEVTVGQMKKKTRKDYLDSYKQIVAKMEELTTSTPDHAKAVSELRTFVLARVNELRKIEHYSPVANSLVHLVNHTLSGYNRGPTTSLNVVNQFNQMAKEKHGENPKKEDLAEAVKDIIEGKSMNVVFGKKGKREDQFDPSEAYVKVAERKGPKTGLASKEKQTDFLMKKVGLRGLQWGNSITDDERIHHLAKSAEAMKDLADVLGLPPEMISFHGRLGFAIGARGKGNSMAHYEPTRRVINLTRKSGVGSVAHEWGHFLDNVLSEVEGGGKSGYLSQSTEYLSPAQLKENPLKDKMHSINKELDNFRNRIRGTDTFRGMSSGRRNYWASTIELFARSFEKYVDHKLVSQDRKNTYLAGALDHELWPTQEEMKRMAPVFDEFFKYFRGSKYMKKAMLLARYYNLQDEMDNL